MKLTIDLYCSDGSPIGIQPTYIYGRGVGGAELAMMSWAETMAQRGHTVRIYNDPASPGDYDGVSYLPRTDFNPNGRRHVFVIYRSPNQWVRRAIADVKLFWSCDQYTSGNFAFDIFPFVDRTVCISPYHVTYHREHYSVAEDRIGYFDLGVRLQDYEQEVEKIPGRCIFCSVPDRGLEVLRVLWPRIKERVPYASLVITSDYRLWGALNPLNQGHRMAWLNQPDVTFLGKVERLELTRRQLEAVCQPYSCQYDELFCISAAECQVAGAVPVTSTMGALVTTNKWGVIVPGDLNTRKWQDEFVDQVARILSDDREGLDNQMMQIRARERFDWQVICEQWEHLIETGEYATKEGRITEIEVKTELAQA